MNNLRTSFLLIIMMLTSVYTTADENPQPQFSVVNGRILDPAGNDWIPKGVNIFPDQWNQETTLDCWGFNALRVNHFLDDLWYIDEAIDNTVAAYAGNSGKVVILDLAHESSIPGSGIGSFWGNRATDLAQVYAAYATLYKDNPYVWFEAPNEPGTSGNLDVASWVEMNQNIISAVRATGNTNPIIINGWCWGQDACGWGSANLSEDASAVLSAGDQLLTINGVEQENIIFSAHVYDQYKYDADASKLRNYLERVIAQGKAMIIGEYGSTNGRTNTLGVSTRMLDIVEDLGLGRIAWTWTAGDSNDLTTTGMGSGYLIDDCEHPSNLSGLGQIVWNDLRR